MAAICLCPSPCPFFKNIIQNAIFGVSDTDSMRPVPSILCPQFQILPCPCPRIDCPCPLTTVRVAALEQISRCVGHGGIRLYHQKICSIERRVTNEKLLKNRFLSLVQNHFWSFLALLIKRRSLSPFEMTRLYQNHSKSK